jgi:hypothetical protein
VPTNQNKYEIFSGVIVQCNSSPDKEEFIQGKEVILSAGARELVHEMNQKNMKYL